VRRRIVFTTHTPVAAGNEVHAVRDLLRLGASCDLVEAELREIGGEPFNMTVAGLRLARHANAVSALHAEVSREMWRDVTGACEIIPITNGVHRPTWQDARIREALGSATGLRATHEALKQEMLAAVAQRTGVRLDANVLTIGFARRAAGYKRSDLRRASSRCSPQAGCSSCSPARLIPTTPAAGGSSPTWSRWRGATPTASSSCPTTTWGSPAC